MSVTGKKRSAAVADNKAAKKQKVTKKEEPKVEVCA
jgi:hypothetical protein